MFPVGNNAVKTTSHKVVLPFYLYAAFSFVTASLLLLLSAGTFTEHYFQPHTLAVTHLMALGWGTMIILGASHQLVPVIVEGKLFSERLAAITFFLAGLGIPFLAYGFYTFQLDGTAIFGAWMIVAAIIVYVINLAAGIIKSKSENVQAIYAFTASIWLLITVGFGLTLLYNFTHPFLSSDSLHYLPLHAHFGIIGWFLLMVIGVGSRLIPMFLISKYTNTRLLWWIYYLINIALVFYLLQFLFSQGKLFLLLPVFLMLTGVILFGWYITQAIKHRIRKQIDRQVRISILSVGFMLLPILFLMIIILIWRFISESAIPGLLTYGFLTFFGWITAIILGMTFKTMPFIVWNKVYHQRSGKSKVPSPKDLFSQSLFFVMSVAYFTGLIMFISGIFTAIILLLQIGATLLLTAALLYTINVLKIYFHKPTGL